MIYKTLILLAFLTMGLKFDFGQDKDGDDWYVINDGVMGGLSKGAITRKENSFVFAGTVSLANNGGFTSYRTPFQPFDLSAYDTLSIKLRSTGIQMAIVMETEKPYYKPNYKYALPKTEGEWTVIDIPLKELGAYRLGNPLGYQLDKEKQAEIIRIGLITNEKRADKFEIELDYLVFR